MGRRRTRSRSGKRAKGGVMTSMRGGFRSAVRAGTGQGGGKAAGSRRSWGTVLTVVLLVVAAVVLLRRFGVLP